ncbi:chromophore lyase CpcT/CpeT [Synechococcus sp. CS-1326]|uniref:chromophore lyase CpcT/CpeT n=1 Tax=Synechococcus sp. CS-1326 TaxID=2847978 RepID=UPI00223B9F12|nr:chromophore lyase CpcT/CpeT [Synechococcus sp. CS-1326]
MNKTQLSDAEARQCIQLMVGSFRNDRQFAAYSTEVSHIQLAFRPINAPGFDGCWLYSEQSYTFDLWRPYRQGVHHVRQLSDRLRFDNFSPPDALLVAGASHEPSLLQTLERSKLTARPGCAMEFFPRDTGGFRGQLEEGCRCMVPRDGQLTYLVSEVLLEEGLWRSRDFGCDPKTHEQRWGLTERQFEFELIESFAHELTQSFDSDEPLP